MPLEAVPVIVSVYVLVGVCAPVNTVSTEDCGVVPLNVTEVGLKLALDCGGNPLTLRFTIPLNPEGFIVRS